MALPKEEWLSMAKRLPVGQADRVQHRFESRKNMVVRNKPDGWSAYCHACGEGGFVPKEFVKLAPVEPESYRQLLPADLKRLTEVDEYARLTVYRFLASKGMDSLHLQQAVLFYSGKSKRLVLGLQNGSGESVYLGRSIVNAQPKWVQYSNPLSGYPTYSTVGQGSTVVITEDVFSALKVQWACPDVQAVCSLGTKLSDELVLYLMRSGKPVIVFYDGDRAGVSGAQKGRKRLQGLGLTAAAITVPGNDPKDLPGQRIRGVLCV